MWYMRRQIAQIFLSTPSARRATRSGWPAGYRLAISIHALREEGDEASKFAAQRTKLFLSTPSARRATNDHNARIKEEQFLSTPSARRATFLPIHQQGIDGVISIHALREEGDAALDHALAGAIQFLSTPSARRATERQVIRVIDFGISIHALREEGDCLVIVGGFGVLQFLSTPSARRATVGGAGRQPTKDISIHALREEGDSGECNSGASRRISIHALREEGDTKAEEAAEAKEYFYPRPPRGGRLRKPGRTGHSQKNFYPRPPRGGRPQTWANRPFSKKFLSTPSARRATRRRCRETTDQRYFYPRPPRGGRPEKAWRIKQYRQEISIHALREEGDTLAATLARTYKISIHALREEGDLERQEYSFTKIKFLSTPSARRATHMDIYYFNVPCNFYPRPPRGGRPGTTDKPAPYEDFYPRPPRGGRLPVVAVSTTAPENFYPRPPRGGRRAGVGQVAMESQFLSTPSARRATYLRRFPLYTRTNFYPRPPRGGRHGSSSRWPLSL